MTGTAIQQGDHRVELNVPQSDEMLTQEVFARIPNREIKDPQRNDTLLKDIADKTGGEYYIGLTAAINGVKDTEKSADQDDSVGSVTQVLLPLEVDETELAGTPNKDFEELLMSWLIGIICGALCLEWLIRRLSKLA